MNDMQKELLSELISDWSIEKIESYIELSESRVVEMNEMIRHLKNIRKKKMHKPPLDTGARDGR